MRASLEHGRSAREAAVSGPGRHPPQAGLRAETRRLNWRAMIQSPAPLEPDAGGDKAESRVLFDALLTPYRSLSPTGFTILMSAIGLVAFAAGLAFYLIGAWPVIGFGGVELGLFWLMFRLNYRSARISERVRLTPGSLTVERRDLEGEVERWSFPAYWLRVELAEPTEPDSPLVLSSHGRSLAIGRFLPPGERLEFANALRAALATARG